MRIKFKMVYLIGITAAIILLVSDYFLLFKTRWFWPIVIISINLAWLQFWIDFFKETKRQKEIELAFVDFIRNLTESVKSGISIPKSILHASSKDYGELTPYVKKLSHQIEWGIPTRKALMTFSEDTNNKVIKRSVSIMIEAEQSGGDIRDILESIVNSAINVKKLKEERKTSVYSQVVQGYIVYIIFIAIMLVLQLWLFPKLGNISPAIGSGLAALGTSSASTSGKGLYSLDLTFFSLIIIQGFFAGIMIGKFSEGTLKNGLLHSLILMTLAALIVTTAKGTI